METKATSAQSRGDGGGAALTAARSNKGCGALRAQPGQAPLRPLPRAEDAPGPATEAGAGPEGRTHVLGRPPRAPGEAAPRGSRLARPAAPLLPPGSPGAGEADAGPRSRRRRQRLLPGRAPPPTSLVSPPGLPRSRRVAGNTSKSSSSRRGRSLMARPVWCPVPVRECAPRLRR